MGLRIAYDPHMGHPSRIDVDDDAGVADDGIRCVVHEPQPRWRPRRAPRAP